MKYSGFFRNFRMCSDNSFRGWKFREAKRASSIETSRKLSSNGFIGSTNEFDVSHAHQDSTTCLHVSVKSKATSCLQVSEYFKVFRQQEDSKNAHKNASLSKRPNTRNSIMMMLCTDAYDMCFILCRANTTMYFFVLREVRINSGHHRSASRKTALSMHIP